MVNTETNPEFTSRRVGLAIGTGTSQIEVENVNQYLLEAATWLSDQIDHAIDHKSCDEEEAEAIRNLAAIKCYYHITGTSSVGWTATMGAITFSGAPDKIAMLKDLWVLINAFIKKHKASQYPFRAGEAEY